MQESWRQSRQERVSCERGQTARALWTAYTRLNLAPSPNDAQKDTSSLAIALPMWPGP